MLKVVTAGITHNGLVSVEADIVLGADEAIHEVLLDSPRVMGAYFGG